MELYEEFYRKMKELDDVVYTDDYVILDDLKNLDELNVAEQYIIDKQDKLHNYDKIKSGVDKINNIYGMCKYLIYGSKWIPFV